MKIKEDYKGILTVYPERCLHPLSDLPLWKKALNIRISEIIQRDLQIQKLKDFAMRVVHETWKAPCRHWGLQHVQQEIIDPMVEKFLTQRAVNLRVLDPQKISFLVQDLGGYGDLIFGVKLLKILSRQFPKTSFHMVTSGEEKLRKVLQQETLNCQISKIQRRGFEPSFDRETQKTLETSDIVFVSPSSCFFVPPKVKANKRDITLLEYNRPDYGLDIRKRTYVTGIGDQACGIFLDPPIEPGKREETLQKLENRSLTTLLQTLDPSNDQPLYFGYGHQDVERFLTVLLNYETRNGIILTPHFDRMKVSFPKNSTVIMHQKAHFIDVLQAFQKQDVPIDVANALQDRQKMIEHLENYLTLSECPISQKRIETVDQIIAEAQQNSKPAKNFESSLEDGYCEMGRKWLKNECLSRAPGGNTIHLIVFEGLSFQDTKQIKSIADEIRLSTGDQSFSEDIGTLMMYDTRKRQPIEALANVANKQGLNYIAQYFNDFVNGNIPQTIACLHNRGKLRQEADVLFDIVRREMDLEPQLIGLVKRQLNGQLDAHQVHECFASFSLHPTDEMLVKIQSEINQLEAKATN